MTKIIDGKKFTQHVTWSYWLKWAAQEEATALRKKGYYVRIIKITDPFVGVPVWKVYKRKK